MVIRLQDSPQHDAKSHALPLFCFTTPSSTLHTHCSQPNKTPTVFPAAVLRCHDVNFSQTLKRQTIVTVKLETSGGPAPLGIVQTRKTFIHFFITSNAFKFLNR